ncbi:MAG: aspartate ammonia-lyase, partial [Pirellulaceae bacterium]|nr:aspartate ammonia-lyase [Pirellulaceae bacterium]
LKISSDLRLLSSGPRAGLGEVFLPPRQAGSSIMPTKVNPVIPEAVSQVALRVMAHDQEITQACALGNLELNAFLPLVADALLDSLELLTGAARILRTHCVAGLSANSERCRAHLAGATATATALVPALGYQRAGDAAREAEDTGRTIRDVVFGHGWLTPEAFDYLVTPEAVTRLGTPLEGDK